MATVWGRSTHGCNGQAFTYFWSYSVYGSDNLPFYQTPSLNRIYTMVHSLNLLLRGLSPGITKVWPQEMKDKERERETKIMRRNDALHMNIQVEYSSLQESLKAYKQNIFGG